MISFSVNDHSYFFCILEIVLNPKDSLVLYHPSAHQFFAIAPTHRVSTCDQL